MPPDGEFELMRYRITDGLQLPFKVWGFWGVLGFWGFGFGFGFFYLNRADTLPHHGRAAADLQGLRILGFGVWELLGF